MIKYLTGIAILLIIIVVSCNKTDETPPIIFMNGADSLAHVLNQPYEDEGATATDETDGNITTNIYVDNQINVDRVGWYKVIYKVIDDAGNEAAPATRNIYVYNEASPFVGYYQLTETQLFPDQNICSYDIFTWIDSTVNYRIVFDNFACAYGQSVVADVSGQYLLVPFQTIEDSLSARLLQGSGTITDSTMQFDYTLKNDSITTLWEAELIKYN